LCTINSQKSVEHILERFGIATYFNVVVTRNQVTHVKPDPEHIEAALKALAVSPTEAVIVGDSSVDMRAARVLGAVAVGLPTGVSTVEQLVDNGANYIVTSMFDLPQLIEKIETIRVEHVKD
jgi:phosphoglycolate phosphatase-like HAD superfamily hydrolase